MYITKKKKKMLNDKILPTYIDIFHIQNLVLKKCMKLLTGINKKM